MPACELCVGLLRVQLRKRAIVTYGGRTVVRGYFRFARNPIRMVSKGGYAGYVFCTKQ